MPEKKVKSIIPDVPLYGPIKEQPETKVNEKKHSHAEKRAGVTAKKEPVSDIDQLIDLRSFRLLGRYVPRFFDLHSHAVCSPIICIFLSGYRSRKSSVPFSDSAIDTCCCIPPFAR